MFSGVVVRYSELRQSNRMRMEEEEAEKTGNDD